MAAAERRAPRALVLTAGLGTRLQPLTYVRAKAAVPVNGEPLVAPRHPLAGRAPASATSSSTCTIGRRRSPRSSATAATSACASATRGSSRCSGRPAARGTPCRSLTDADDDDFLIVNGDTLTDVDIWSLVARHRRSGALVTMALIPEPAAGPVRRRARSPATAGSRGFTRAGRRHAGGDRPFHFIGVQVASARAFAALEDGVPAESVNALYPAPDRRSIRGASRRSSAARRSSTSARRATASTRRSRSPRRRRPARRRAARAIARFGGARPHARCGMM